VRHDDAVARIRARRAARPARKRVPPALQPDSVRREYFARLKRLNDQLASIVEEHLGPVLRDIARADSVRADAPPPADGGLGVPPPPNPGPRVRAAVRAAAEAAARLFSQNELISMGEWIGGRTSEFQKQQWIKQAKAVIGVDPTKAEPWLPEMIRDFTRENVDLIRTLPTRVFADIEKHVTEAAMGGARHETLARTLQERLQVSEARAKLIARDQVGKFYGSLAETRQKDAGVTHYVWRTKHDNRVREEHEALDGKKFAWSSPPDEGHPGEAVNCRCSAEPDLEELLKFEESPTPERASARGLAEPGSGEEGEGGDQPRRLTAEESADLTANGIRSEAGRRARDIALDRAPVFAPDIFDEDGTRLNGFFNVESRTVYVATTRPRGSWGVRLDGPARPFSVSMSGASEQDARKITYAHEVGHAIEMLPAAAKAIRRALAEPNRAPITVNAEDPEQYFAECFAAFEHRRKYLEQNDPVGYRMVLDVLRDVGAR
jgi:SPP1 gp7 family putative phage head morphogenesis protein